MSAKGVVARLAGVPLSAVGPVGWAFTPGGKPHTRLIEVSERAAEALKDKRGVFVTLEIEAAPRAKLVVEKLLIVDIRAGSTPYTRRVMVADRRYLWRRKTIVRDFNMRRRTGETRLSKEGRIENKKLAADVAYAPWSLEAGVPFDAVAVLRSILAELEPGASISIPPISRQVAIEDLFLNDPGDVAVDKALAFLAGIGVWIDKTGAVRVFDTRNYGENAIITSAGAPLQGHGYHGRAIRAYARPIRINVLLEREAEVRFDFVEATSDIATVVRSDREPRSLENVIMSPDVTFLYRGNQVGRGTVLELNAFLDALAATGTHTRTFGISLGPLTQTLIRKYALGQWHLMLSTFYGVTTTGQPDTEWIRRVNAVRSSWRRLFRPLPRWRDKMRSMKAVRVAMFDPETGTRAPTEAYMDYITKPSDAAWYKVIRLNPDIGHQVAGWAEHLKDATAAPAVVTVLDEQSGLILVDLKPDPWGNAEALAPGNVAKLPTHAVTGDISADVIGLWGTSPLLPTFKMALVLSCIQGAPNNAGRYHRVTVEPAAGAQVLGVNIGECLGEEMTIYVPAGTAVARFMWSDDQKDQIENAFFDGGPMPIDLLSNPEQVKAVAEAAAAREWAQFLDREEGAFTVALNASVEIDGAIAIVEHTVPPNGPPVTSLAVYPEMQALDPMTLVPSSVQRTIRHLVQP